MPIGEVILSVKDLSNATEYADVSFDLRKGEILGLYGLVGAGRTEAVQCLFGVWPGRWEGKIYIERLYPYDKAGTISLIRGYGILLEEEYLPEGIRVKAYVPKDIYPRV